MALDQRWILALKGYEGCINSHVFARFLIDLLTYLKIINIDIDLKCFFMDNAPTHTADDIKNLT